MASLTLADNPTKKRSKVAGFSLVAALFIIVVLGILAAALFRMTQTSNVAVAQEILSIRAFYAAESGAQAAAMRLFPLSGASACLNQTLNFTSPGLVGCSATISCSQFVANGETYYQVSSEGQCGSGDWQTSRTVEVMLRDL